jgi:hypothetical protein
MSLKRNPITEHLKMFGLTKNCFLKYEYIVAMSQPHQHLLMEEGTQSVLLS